MEPKFTQLYVAQWEGDNGRQNYTLYGLTKSGTPMVFRRQHGWVTVEQDVELHRGEVD